jgi:hypothetical protein
MLDIKKKMSLLQELPSTSLSREVNSSKRFQPSLDLPTSCDFWRISIFLKALWIPALKLLALS